MSEPTREELIERIENLENLAASLAFLHTRTKDIIDGSGKLPIEEQRFHIIGAMPRIQGHRPNVAIEQMGKRDIDWGKAGKALYDSLEMMEDEDSIWRRPEFPDYVKFSIEAEIYGLNKEEARNLSLTVLWALLDDPHIVSHKIESEELDYGEVNVQNDPNDDTSS